LGFGIDIVQDLYFFSLGSVKAYVVIGLLATSMIIVVQLVMRVYNIDIGGSRVEELVRGWASVE
jgi:hypothetical protein